MLKSRIGTIFSGSGGEIRSPSFLPPKQKKPEKTKTEQRASDLGLKLLTKDDLSEDELMRLAEDTTIFVRDCINSGNFSDAEDFIIKHKDHFTPEIKEMITIEIGNQKSNNLMTKKPIISEVRDENNNITIEIKFGSGR